MKLSGISRKLSSVIAGGLIALILPLSNCKLSERTRTIEPVAWADVNRDGVKDAIIKHVKIIDAYTEDKMYNESLVAVDGKNIRKEKEDWVTNDFYNIFMGAFGSFDLVEGLSISPKRQKWGSESYIPLHARTLASKDGKFSDVTFKDDGLRISAYISTISDNSSWPNKYTLFGICSLGYKMNDFGEVKKDK
jgi:hypothetical protein